MELRFDSIEKERFDTSISSDIWPGRNFLSEDFAEWKGLSNPPDQLDTLAQRHEISKVGEILGVNDRIVKWIARVDVNTTLAERMLEGYLDNESLLFGGGRASGPQQDFKMPNAAQQELLCSRPVDSLVAVYDALVLAGAQVIGRSINHPKDLVLEVIGRFRVSECRREVDISDSRVDIRKER